jgi:hypothetical protein
MTDRRWFNARVPQTLAISQILLYINGAFALLAAIASGPPLAKLIMLLSAAANIYGGYGIANESRRGYQVAVGASFLPLVGAAVAALLSSGGLFGNLFRVLLPGGPLNALFVYALIALLLHTQSREHQRAWFS